MVQNALPRGDFINSQRDKHDMHKTEVRQGDSQIHDDRSTWCLSYWNTVGRAGCLGLAKTHTPGWDSVSTLS